MVTCSTALIEALFLKKPVIMMDFFQEHDHYSYVKEGAVIYIDSPEDLKSAIARVREADFIKTQKEKIVRYTKHYYGELDGRASNRVAEFIIDLLNEKAK